MTDVIKSGNSGDTLFIDKRGRAQTFSTVQTNSTAAALLGDSFNINTATTTLTTDNSSALLYLENTDDVPWTIPRVFYNAEVSVGGAGGWLAEVVANPTSGTLLDAGVDFEPVNFNFGSPSKLVSICKRGSEGSTALGGIQGAVSTVIPSSGTRVLISFDSVVLLPGSKLAIIIKPPTGNTSMNIQVGVNVFRNVVKEIKR